MPLDPVGNISLVLQITILFLLVLGLPFVRGQNNQRNLMRHGYSTVIALVLHTILIFLVMVPTLANGVSEFRGLSLFYSITVWSHVILGTAAEVSGIVLVAFWLLKGPSKMMCGQFKKWMMPILIIWIASIFNGSLVHILGML